MKHPFLLFVLLILCSSCNKDNISGVEYSGKWAFPISHSKFLASSLIDSIIDPSISISEDSTKLFSFSYESSEKKISFNEIQENILDFDTSISYNVSTHFPQVLVPSTQKFYYRDTVSFDIHDFSRGFDVMLDSLCFKTGVLLCNIDSQMPDGWSWSCNVFSENLILDDEIFRLTVDQYDINEEINIKDYLFVPNNNLLHFVCDITLTVVGPCPEGDIAFNTTFGFKDIQVERMFGNFKDVHYSAEGSATFEIFSSIFDNIDMELYNSVLNIPIVSDIGTSFKFVFDYVTVSNKDGDTKNLVIPGSSFITEAPENIGDFVYSNIYIPIVSDAFTIEPTRIDYKVTLFIVDDNTKDYFFSDNYTELKLIIEVPLIAKVNMIHIVDTFNFDGFNIDDISSINLCQLIADFENAIPFEWNAVLSLTDNLYNIIDTVFDGGINVDPPTIGSDYKIVSPSLSSHIWNLDNNQLQAMNKACNLIVELRAKSPEDKETIKIFSDEYVGLKLKTVISFNDIIINE